MGKADIIWHDAAGDTALWLMNGTQIVQSASFGTVPPVWSIVGTGDFNGDGKFDLLWRDSSGNTAIWLLNGAQVLGSPSIDGDGMSDVMWRDSSSGTVSIWFMNGGQVTSAANVGVVSQAWTIQSAGAE
jgi:hypothetical protein